jgi:transcriptional regulator with XRE-family HTH domain
MGRQKSESPGASAFGERVRAIRLRLGLTQEGLGQKAGLHFTYIGAVERGERNVTLATIIRIAEALETDPGQLVDRINSVP